jgi:beta-glucanase (GH16 family)
MKKGKFYFKEIGVVLILNLFLLGCSPKDDSNDPEPIPERTKITMETPGSGEIDWNNVELVWNEEFSASTILDDIWVFESKNTTNPDIADQLQNYREENVSLSGGKLKISAKNEAGVYTSAKLSSKYAFKYGRIEIGAKLPEQEKKGIWAKMALIGDNENIVGWPACGEIDLMEYFSHKPNETYINVHSSANNALNGTLISANSHLESAEEEFHAYGILWTDKYIKFYIDDPDNIIYTLDRPSSPTDANWPFDKHFYLLADMVIGGRYGGAEGVDDSLFPAIMEIDYIRVYHTQ